MELRQLRHFVAVAEEANFTRAAERCHIVQSALSTSIRLLEEELGTRLLVRTTRHVSLSEAGVAFLESARSALGILDRAVAGVARMRSARRRTLSIGIVQSLPPFLALPALLSRFDRAHPQVEVRLVQDTADVLNARVEDRQLDLAILPIDECNERLVSRIVACDRMVLACDRGHPLAGAASVTLDQLTGEAFVDFVPGQGTRGSVDRGFAAAGLQRGVAFEVGDLDTLLDLVSQGLGVAVLPEDIVASRAGRFACVGIEAENLCWELVVTHLAAAGYPDDTLDPAPAAFLAMLLAGAAEESRLDGQAVS